MTELKIAKQNIKNEEEWVDNCTEGCQVDLKIAETHKESCKRFLEFLEMLIDNHKLTMGKDASVPTCIPVKIQDLKESIKEYEEKQW